MSKKFLENLFEKLLADKCVRDAVEKLRHNANELAAFIAQQISTCAINETLANASDVAPTQPQPVASPTETPKRRATDWHASSDATLRSAVYYRKKNNLPIEPELNSELSARFPGWDATTQKFTRARPANKSVKSDATTEKSHHQRATDWHASSDATLRSAVYYRKKNNLPIEPELNSELSARFPGWDAATQKFTRARPANKSVKSDATTEKSHHQRVTDWHASSDAALRAAVYYRKKNNLPIDPELNSELSARFPGWDATTQKFTRARPATATPEKTVKKTVKKTIKNTVKKTAVTPVPTITGALVPLYSSVCGDGKFSLFFDNGVSRNIILSRAGEPYELCLFDIKTNYAVVRKNCDVGQSRLYVIDCASGNIVPETKTGVSYVCWLSGSHDLFTLQKTDSLRSGWHLMEHGRIARPVVIPARAKMIRAGAIGNETILLDVNGVAHVGDMLRLSDFSGASNQNDAIKKIMFKPVVPEMPLPEIAAPAPETVATQPVVTDSPVAAPSADQLLRITVKPVRTTLHGTYNNIMVNGRKILSNHFGSEIKLLSDDAVLAIRGIVTDDKSLPETMQWRVYYADLTSAVPSVKQSYSSYNAHARAVHQMPDGGVRIDMSNRSSVFPKVDRIRKIANGRRFVLDEKHR